MHPTRAAGGRSRALPGRAGRPRASWWPVSAPVGWSGGRRVPRWPVAARSTRRFSLGTPGYSRTNPLVLFDDILDHRLPRGVLRAAILLGDELVPVADERIAFGIVLMSRPQVDGGTEMTLRRVQIVHSLRRRGQRFGEGRALRIGELDRKSTRLNSSHLVISYAV